ncbi:MAG TPA: CHAD domain-containing protein [Kofleriaceae bacterium]|nr:CHAD domain-containing protein [Kofleriaceae bacterium]
MATTTTGDNGSKVDVVQFSEQDKLGPIGNEKRSLLDDEAELRRVLVSEFSAAADAAREAAGSVDRGVTTAVHEYRKALRRARAVLSLLGRALPKSERRAINRALRDARRALGTARDHAVAPDTLGVLTLGEVERGTADEILRTATEAMPAVTEIKQLLAEGAARAAAQVEALEAALPQTIGWKSVEQGIRNTYKDARNARKSAKRSRRSFHAWRRRSKELGYQLDLLAGYAGMRVQELAREIEGVTDTQGPAVDLVMLRDFVNTHATGVAGEAVDTLVGAVENQIDDLVKDSRRAGRDAFSRKPRRFARRLTKAVRRDLAPVVVPDEVD